MSPNDADNKICPRELDAWFTPGRFAAILAGLIAITFFNVLIGQETFFYRDFGVFGYPLAHYQRECFWRGELPLWNPLSYCGMPFLAQWNSMTLYPLSLFYLIFPLSWSLGVFNLGHIFLAGLGMYFLARRWMANGLAASAAGVVFAFNGLTWYSLMWPNDIAALGWMPWVVMLMERAWREGGRMIVAGAIGGALQMLTGAPEVILLTWVICGMLWLGQFVRGSAPRRRMVTGGAVAGILVAGLAAAQLLPFLDLLKHSHRDTGFSDSGWAMPVSGVANFIAPLFHCSAGGGHGVFVQYDQYWTSSYYLGAGTVVLALVAAWRVRKARVALLAVMAVGSVLMALGKNGLLYSLIKTVLPQLGFMRYPIKFVVVAVFVIPILAGYAVRWNQEAGAGSMRERRSLQIVAITLLAMLGVLVILEWMYPLKRDDWSITWMNIAGRGVFVVLVPGVLIMLQRAVEYKLQLLLRISLLVILWMDVFTHAPNLSPTVDRSVFQTGIIRADMKLDAVPHVGEPRVMQTAAAADKIRYTSLSKPAEDYLCRRLSLYDNCNLLDDVPKIDGFYSLYLKEMAQVLGLIYECDARNTDLKGVKDFLEVAHISATDATSEKALEWVTRNTFMPLVTAGQKPIFSSDTNTLVKLTSLSFEPRLAVFLPPEAKARITATSNVTAKITSPHFTSERLDMQVDSSGAAMVVVAQGFYYPWHAYVDGKRTELWRANYAFQALEVPGGKHQVSLIYEDKVFRLGLVISGGAIMICAILWFQQRNKLTG